MYFSRLREYLGGKVMTTYTKQELKVALERINMAIIAIREELHWEDDYSSRIELMARQNSLLDKERKMRTALAAL